MLKRLSQISLILVAIYLMWLITARSIDLTTADLGRHIINGRIITKALELQNFEILEKLFHTNFYSYSMPEENFLNHHWLTGIVYSGLERLIGFNGLTIVNMLSLIAASLIFGFSAKLISNSNYAFLSLFISIPIACSRTEVRPESFSFLLLAIVFLILTLYDQKKLSAKWLFTSLAIIQLVWINLHIFYIFGIFLAICFGIKYLIEKDKKRTHDFLKLGVILLATSFLNPSGLEGVLYPLSIFHGYGYDLAENQTILFMQQRYPNNPLYPYFEILCLVNLSFLVANRKNTNWAHNLITISLFFVAFKTNRAMSLFALVSIPCLSHNLKIIKFKFQNIALIISAALSIFFIFFYRNIIHRNLTSFKFNPQTQASAEFFKANNIQGPIFNNYDIGGYLIYHLFPNRKIFIDNRPEAYNEEFLQQRYLKALELEEAWLELDEKYKFNTIYFYRHDNTEFGQPYLIRRVKDRKIWAPVFVDGKTIIFLKRNETNQAIIASNELPEEMFKAVKN